jgi:hypothetical protein
MAKEIDRTPVAQIRCHTVESALMTRILPTAVVCLTVLLASAAELHACSCSFAGPPCEATWEAGAVFVGRVVGATTSAQNPLIAAAPELRVRVRVLEAFRGDARGFVDVFTPSESSACGFAFSIGETYLVYARSGGGRLFVGLCSRILRIDEAAADLAYLRGPAKLPSSSATLEGTVTRSRRGEPRRTPIPSVTVVARTNEGQRYVGRTGSDGAYQIRVPIGTFFVFAELPDGPTAGSSVLLTEVRDLRGCRVRDIHIP